MADLRRGSTSLHSCFQNYKHLSLIHTLSNKAFNGTVLKLALPSLHGGSLEIRLTVSFNKFMSIKEHIFFMI